MGRPVSPHRWRLRLLIAFAAMGLAYAIFPWLIHGQASRSAPPPPVARGIPVVVAPAETGDIGVYLTGLGTATALKTVTVQSRVDGQLINVAFREGQLVRPGDLLAELDPRPFEVQLAQARARRRRTKPRSRTRAWICAATRRSSKSRAWHSRISEPRWTSRRED